MTSTYPRLIYIVRYIPLLDGCISIHVYSRDKLRRQVNESEYGDVSETASNVQNNNMNDYFSTYNEFYIMRAGKNKKKMSSSGVNTNRMSNYDLNKRELRLDNFFYESLLSNNEFTKCYYSKDLEVRYFNDEIFNSIEGHLRGDRLKLTKQYNRIASSSLHYYINTYVHSNERLSLNNNNFISPQLSFNNRNRSMLNILCSPVKQKGSSTSFLGNNDNSLDLVIHSVLSKIISENKSVLRKNFQKEKKIENNFAMTSPLRMTGDINGFSVTKIAALKTILSYLNGIEDESSFMLSEDYSFMDAGVANRKTSDFNFNDMSLLFSNISFEQIYKNHIQNFKNNPFTKGASDSQTNSSHNVSYRIHPKINQKKERELLDMINNQFSEIGLINQAQKGFSPINKNPRIRKTAVLDNWETNLLQQQQKLSEKRAFSLGQTKLSHEILNLMNEIKAESFKIKNSNNHQNKPFSNDIANLKEQNIKAKYDHLLYSSTENEESPFSINLKPTSVFKKINNHSNITSESEKASETPTANKEMMKDNYRVSEETESNMSGSFKGNDNTELISFKKGNEANPYFDAINFSVKAISPHVASDNHVSDGIN